MDEVDLVVDEGEVLSLIGPNGAGKTTLFNLVSGFLAPSAGSARYQGRDIAGLPPLPDRRHGAGPDVSEDQHLLGNSRPGRCRHRLPPARATRAVGSILFHTRRAQGRAGGRGAAGRATSWPSPASTPWAHQLGKNLPYGKQRILEVAVALAASPRLLLLDEPAAGLNPAETNDADGADPPDPRRARGSPSC
ncbi:MAG: ATP-binding cassette domain-containing protein [Rhodopseudomonas palustris]|nr:ATP-binding cassette domain-containing protein [Rhodopseudomonas palustris]